MRIKNYWMMLAIASVSLFTIGCSGDDEGNRSGNEKNTQTNGTENLTDPEGTMIANVSNNEETSIELTGMSYLYQNGYHMEKDGLIADYISAPCYLTIDNSNNFYSRTNHNWIGGVLEYACIGEVKGLSAIKSVPQTGWTKKTAVVPNYGYVVKRDTVYARVFVVDWIDTSHSGAIIKYQTKWIPDTE